MGTHPSVLAWRIPGMAEPGGLQSMGSHRVAHDKSDLAAATAAAVAAAICISLEKFLFRSFGHFKVGLSFYCWAVKNLPANAGDIRDVGSIPGSGKSPGEGNCNPLQYSCLENPMDGEAW